MSNFRLIDRETGFLMPPSVDEWLPPRHLARFVVEVVSGLDLRAMIGSYRGIGRGVVPSRAAAGPDHLRLCHGRVLQPPRLLAACYLRTRLRSASSPPNQHPDHDTIATFRRRFLGEIEDLCSFMCSAWPARSEFVELGLRLRSTALRSARQRERVTARCRMSTRTRSRRN